MPYITVVRYSGQFQQMLLGTAKHLGQ